MGTIDAFHVLFYKDIDSESYIRNQSNAAETKAAVQTEFSLHDIILHGLKDEVEQRREKNWKRKNRWY